MAIILAVDLPAAIQSHELVSAMVAGANAKASRVAPCLVATDPPPSEGALDEAKLILLGAIKRWVEAGSGALQSQTAGPFSAVQDTRLRTGYNLWPSEIEALQAVCSSGGSVGGKAFSIRPSRTVGNHVLWCALAFGALYCSCGSDLANFEYPLFEGGALSVGGDEYP